MKKKKINKRAPIFFVDAMILMVVTNGMSTKIAISFLKKMKIEKFKK